MTTPATRTKGKDMKSIIFYVAKHNTHIRGPYWPVYSDADDVSYVRAETVEDDALRALDLAKPRKGETVLNSVELP